GSVTLSLLTAAATGCKPVTPGVNVIVTGTDWPAASVPRLKFTVVVPSVAVAAWPPPVLETKVDFAGRTTTRAASATGSGPPFVTVTVLVSGVPTTPRSGVTRPTWRSALATVGVTATASSANGPAPSDWNW